MVGSPRDATERDTLRRLLGWAASAVAVTLDGMDGTPEEKACLGASGAQMAVGLSHFRGEVLAETVDIKIREARLALQAGTPSIVFV